MSEKSYFRHFFGKRYVANVSTLMYHPETIRVETHDTIVSCEKVCIDQVDNFRIEPVGIYDIFTSETTCIGMHDTFVSCGTVHVETNDTFVSRETVHVETNDTFSIVPVDTYDTFSIIVDDIYR